MRGVPADIAKNYSILLRNKGIPSRNHYHFQKWLRYYVVFCQKYQFILADRDSLPLFVRKLHEKSQSVYQQKQASHAIALYSELLTGTPPEALEGRALRIGPRISVFDIDTFVFAYIRGRTTYVQRDKVVRSQ